MFKCCYVILFFFFVLFVVCSSKLKFIEIEMIIGMLFGGFLFELQYNVMQMGGDFVNNLNVQQFIDRMVNKYGFDCQQLQEIFFQVKCLDLVLWLMDNQVLIILVKLLLGLNGVWLCYCKKFIMLDNVQNGVVFWNQYEDVLNCVWQVYGVLLEIIVGIIGVEICWGCVMGKICIFDVLVMLLFNYLCCVEYFFGELEIFLLMVCDEQDDLFNLKGFFVGVMGYGQFMLLFYK